MREPLRVVTHGEVVRRVDNVGEELVPDFWRRRFLLDLQVELAFVNLVPPVSITFGSLLDRVRSHA